MKKEKLKYGEDFKVGKWTCNKDRGNAGDMLSCRSNKGKLLSAFGDETVRFSSTKQVKIDGKVIKELEGYSGVELE